MFLRRYATGTGADVIIPIIKRGVVDFAVGADWTPAAGDVRVSLDGGTSANIATLPTAITMGNTAAWRFTFSNAELTCKTLTVTIADAATKAIEDQCFIIETFGNAAAQFASDLAAAQLPANVTHFGGSAGTFAGGRPEVNLNDGAINAAKIATDAITADTIAADAISKIQAGLSTLDAGGVRTSVGLATANLDTQLSGISTKTTNLPSDPADASDIAASFSTINSTLATIAGYIDTEVSAIKAKTDNLPSDPADQSAVEAAISAAIATVPTAAQNAYAVWEEEMADHTGSTTYGGRIVRATNSNVTVQITGSNHIASDVHAFQTDVIDATAFASSAVAEIQNGLATSAALTSVASNVTGIKAKTDNLPADPADASDIAASFASISSTLSTIAAYIDTEVSAIKAKTDNLPSDPADQSAVEAAITAATSVLATAASLATVASELAKVHKQGETRRFTQVAANAGAKTADVTMGAPL